jgi:hypothetical protein
MFVFDDVTVVSQDLIFDESHTFKKNIIRIMMSCGFNTWFLWHKKQHKTILYFEYFLTFGNKFSIKYEIR